MERTIVNGRAGATIAVKDRGFLYGDGLFETLAVRGGQCRFLGLHLARLTRGCERLGLPAPEPGQVSRDLEQAIDGAESGTAKYIVTRGEGERGYAPPADPQLTRVATFTEADVPASKPVRITSCATTAARNPPLAGLKTLNRLEQVLASRELRSADEGLMYDDRDQLVCGTMSNVFVRIDGAWATPDLSEAGVAGVMREVVVELAEEAGISIEIRPVGRRELAALESAFLTNALRGIRPVSVLDERRLTIGDDINTLMKELSRRGVMENAL